MNAVSKPSPLCMACSALAVRGVQRWPSVPHTWWGCGGACNAWREGQSAAGVLLGCRWGAAGVPLGWGCEQRPKLTRASRASPRAAQRAPQLPQLPLSSGWLGYRYLRATEEGAYLPASARAGPLGPACDVVARHVARLYAARYVRAACTRGVWRGMWRGMCVRAGGASPRWPTVPFAPSEREGVGATLP